MINGAVYGGDAFFYLTGTTSTPSGTTNTTCTAPTFGFPVCNAVGSYFQQDNAGETDAFVVRFNSQFELEWSTFYGGTDHDYAFDLDITKSGSLSQDRVFIVGATEGSVPYFGPTGSFSLSGSGSKEAFLASFDMVGVEHWSTNVHGIRSFNAVAATTASVIVTGVNQNILNTTNNGCIPVPNEICLCNPGGGATVQGLLSNTDQYIAEFAALPGILTWSTFIPSTADEAADESMIRMYGNDYHPFRQNKIMDVLVDENNAIYLTGQVLREDGASYAYPTIPQPGLFHKSYFWQAGILQTDVTLNTFLSNRSRYYSTNFGADFFRVNDGYDSNYLDFASDISPSMAYSPGKALYLTGITGEFNNFHRECPYPGTSYCEPNPSVFNQVYDGFIARFNMQGITIGIGEQKIPETADYLNYHSDTGLLYSRSQGIVQVYDVEGRLVRMVDIVAGEPTSLGNLADGIYALRLQDERHQVLQVLKIVR
jgi:hypothetical protein